MTWLFGIVSLIVLSFGLVVFFGAPYLPTLRSQANEALDMLALQKGQHLIDLGSGDGIMLILAAKRGLFVTGYELNPILFLVSWLRTRPYRNQVKVYCRNYWLTDWPDAEAIFVFLHTNFMQRFSKKLKVYSHRKSFRLVSYTFPLPEKKPIKQQGGLYLYEFTGGTKLH